MHRFSLRHAAGLVLAGLVLWLIGDVILLGFAAVLVALALGGAGEWIAARSGWSRRTGVLIVSGSLFLILILGGLYSGPKLVEQGNQLWDQILQFTSYARGHLERYTWGQALLDRASPEQLAGGGPQVARALGLTLMAAFTALGVVVIVFVTALYLAWLPELYTHGFARLLPVAKRERGLEILRATAVALRQWMYGQSISMAVVAITAYAGLALIGVPLAPLLALIAGLTNVVPYVGPIAGAVPALIVALGQGPEVAMWVALLFAAIQFLEGNFLEPVVQKMASHLPPALTILSQTLMGTLFGIPGIILATPVLAAGIVGVRMLYVEDVLERPAARETPKSGGRKRVTAAASP